MNQPTSNQFEDLERGAAEEESDVSMTEMEQEVSKPPEERWADHAERGDDGPR